MTKRIAFYTGSFDPVTNGHLDVLQNAAFMCDKVVIGIGVHPGKTPIFTVAERQVLLQAALEPIAKAATCELEVVTFGDLAIDAAKRFGAGIIVRGLRDSADFDYEMSMAGMNATLEPRVRTVFLPASPGVRHITATLVRQIAQLGGDISSFVPANVAAALAAKFKK